MSLTQKANSTFNLKFEQYQIHTRCQPLHSVEISLKDDGCDDDVIHDVDTDDDVVFIDSVKKCSPFELKLLRHELYCYDAERVCCTLLCHTLMQIRSHCLLVAQSLV